MSESALRYNTGKNRLELVPYELIEEVGKVLTYGAAKYTITEEDGTIVDGSRNWEKGMSWRSVLGSLKRHILEFEKGNLKDEESQLGHLSHAATNIAFLLRYLHTHPEYNDLT